jgi:hypothetical protein
MTQINSLATMAGVDGAPQQAPGGSVMPTQDDTIEVGFSSDITDLFASLEASTSTVNCSSRVGEWR